MIVIEIVRAGDLEQESGIRAVHAPEQPGLHWVAALSFG
jgi:hypothetical protein